MVIDDASTDDTVRVVRERRDPRIELIELADNVGPAEARNRALPRVTTDYFWIVDADCVPAPDCLAKLCAAFSTDPAIGVVGGPNPQNPRTVDLCRCRVRLLEPLSRRSGSARDRRALCRGRQHAGPPRSHRAGRLLRSESYESPRTSISACGRVRLGGASCSSRRRFRSIATPAPRSLSYLRYQYKIGHYGCRFRLKHRAAVPFGRWYPTTPARAALLAPAYVDAGARSDRGKKRGGGSDPALSSGISR